MLCTDIELSSRLVEEESGEKVKQKLLILSKPLRGTAEVV
jgi:hypothetical protein